MRIYRLKNHHSRFTPLLYMDLLLEVVSFLPIADLKKLLNFPSRSLWYLKCRGGKVQFTIASKGNIIRYSSGECL